MCRIEGVGRKNRLLYYSFALSLFLHGTVLFFFSRNAINDASITLALNARHTPIEVRLLPPQTEHTPVTLRSKLLQESEIPTTKRNSQPEGRQKSSDARHSTLTKLVDLKTGNHLDPSYWRGTKVLGKPARIRLTIKPSGFLDRWEWLTKPDISFQPDLDEMNTLIRNMDTKKTGETQVLIWEFQAGKKNGELIVKIYPVSAD